MTEYKCPKCGEVYKSTVDYQKLYCLICNTEILHPRLMSAQKELDKMHEFLDNALTKNK